MHTRHWRRGIATVLATGLLALGASAQNGAEGDVTIKEDTNVPKVQTTTAAQAKPVKPTIVDRDPFVNQITQSGIVSPTTPKIRPAVRPAAANNPEPQARPGADPVAANPPEEVPVVEIPAPEVTVNGIVLSSSGSQAIISTSVGTKLITAGQKLGDYRVSSIGQNYVAFSYGGTKTFKVPLASEF